MDKLQSSCSEELLLVAFFGQRHSEKAMSSAVCVVDLSRGPVADPN